MTSRKRGTGTTEVVGRVRTVGGNGTVWETNIPRETDLVRGTGVKGSVDRRFRVGLGREMEVTR